MRKRNENEFYSISKMKKACAINISKNEGKYIRGACVYLHFTHTYVYKYLCLSAYYHLCLGKNIFRVSFNRRNKSLSWTKQTAAYMHGYLFLVDGSSVKFIISVSDICLSVLRQNDWHFASVCSHVNMKSLKADRKEEKEGLYIIYSTFFAELEKWLWFL